MTAKGTGVERKGFKDGNLPGNDKGILAPTLNDDQIKGTVAGETIYGDAGDDVLIAYAGADTVIGGDGRDDISGGEGDDTLSGGVWTDDLLDGTLDDVDGDTGTIGVVDANELTQDDDRDNFVAGSSFEENGTDTILLYDEPDTELAEGEESLHDVIDLTDAFVLNVADTNGDLVVDQAEIDAALGAMVSYDAATGALSIGGDVWFNVFADAAGTEAADSVVLTATVSTDGGLTTTEMEFTL